MARMRTIKPEFCTSETIAQLSIATRLHFVMLWTYADDEGRGVDNPRLLKAALWPLTDEVAVEDIEQMQKELEAAGRLVRYTESGRQLFQVCNFAEHQRPSKPMPSKLPAPLPNGQGAVRDDSGSVPEPLPPVGVSLGEVSYRVSLGESDAREPSAELKPDGARRPPGGPPLLASGFDAFWERYPRKTGRPEAHKRWAALASRQPAGDVAVLQSLDRWLAYWAAAGTAEQFIPKPANWLREDVDETPPALAKTKGQAKDDAYLRILGGDA